MSLDIQSKSRCDSTRSDENHARITHDRHALYWTYQDAHIWWGGVSLYVYVNADIVTWSSTWVTFLVWDMGECYHSNISWDAIITQYIYIYTCILNIIVSCRTRSSLRSYQPHHPPWKNINYPFQKLQKSKSKSDKWKCFSEWKYVP